jgi:DNA-binding NarL/FixJ family response regulator
MAEPARDRKVVMLTTFDMDEYVYEALQAGASGFLLKDVPPEQLVGRDPRVASGEALLAPSITKRRDRGVRAQAARARAPAARGRRADRARARGAALIARGLSNARSPGARSSAKRP